MFRKPFRGERPIPAPGMPAALVSTAILLSLDSSLSTSSAAVFRLAVGDHQLFLGHLVANLVVSKSTLS